MKYALSEVNICVLFRQRDLAAVCLMAVWPMCHHETAALCVYFRLIRLMIQHSAFCPHLVN